MDKPEDYEKRIKNLIAEISEIPVYCSLTVPFILEIINKHFKDCNKHGTQGEGMGFRCPVCSADFGRNKKEWELHCKTQHYGAGKDMVSLVENITKKHDIVDELTKQQEEG